MSNRNYDNSFLTLRKANKTIAGSFLTRALPPNNTTPSPPYLGINTYSILNNVRMGAMTDYVKCDNGGYTVNIGCPCSEQNALRYEDPGSLIPSGVTNIQITFGSIILTWDAPTSKNGPFTYEINVYLNGVLQKTVTVANGATTYRFTDAELDAWKPYTFSIVAINSGGKGPVEVTKNAVLMPPNELGAILGGEIVGETSGVPGCIKYLLNNSIVALLRYISDKNLGPTKGSRLCYVWGASVAQAWNWVSLSSPIDGAPEGIEGFVDDWNWTSAKCSAPFSDASCDKISWLCAAIDAITSRVIGGVYVSGFSCNESVVNRVKLAGEWDTWVSHWNTWYADRVEDGSVAAATTMPVDSANWGKTINVDGVTVNDISGFPAPSEWTRLTVQGKKQGYLTWNWESVRSTFLTMADETSIRDSVEPLTGSQRDAEIDSVLNIAGSLTDEQKMMAEFWAGGPGTVSPPCMFIWMWKEYVRGLSEISADKIVYSLLDLCVHLFEGGRVTWMLKKQHMEARPIQEIRRRYLGQNVVSWNGTVKGDQWLPYQESNFVTPPFADFPSGHSHFSKAFALTMNSWFGSLQKVSINYTDCKLICPLFSNGDFNSSFGDFLIKKGTSLIQPKVVPSHSIELSFDSWDDMATSAGMSRLYGGIHALTAHQASQTVATTVDGLINSVNGWKINKSI